MTVSPTAKAWTAVAVLQYVDSGAIELTTPAYTLIDKVVSRRRDCHLRAPPCTCSSCFNRDKQGVPVK